VPRTLVLVLAAVLLVAGCVSRRGPEASAPDSTTEETTTTTTAATTSEEEDEPVPAAPENAADGTNYAACTDGTCEVFVTGVVTIPLGPEFGFTEFQVTRTPGSTDVFGGDPVNGNLHAQLGGTGELNANGITMKVTSSDDAGAILEFSPREG
jgi:hypothetical protein